MEPLRVRVELVDQPGALAGVTAVLAGLGVDVASVDVLEIDGSTVVDELVLRLPEGVGPQAVEAALRRGGAVDVLSRRAEVRGGDGVVRALDLLAAVLAAREQQEAAGGALARLAYADAGALVPVEEAVRYPLALRALETGVPASARVAPGACPLPLSSGWVLWVASAAPHAEHLAVVARRLDVRFSATEAARVRSLATVLSASASVWAGP